MNKKAEEMSSVMLWWMFFLVVVVLLGLSIKAFGVYTASNKVNIPRGLEELSVTKQFYDKCFVYTDPAGKMQEDTIDLSKFNQAQLDTCFPNKEAHFAFMLSLELPGSADFQEKAKTIKTKNWVDTIVKQEFVEQVTILSNNKQYKNSKLTIHVKTS